MATLSPFQNSDKISQMQVANGTAVAGHSAATAGLLKLPSELLIAVFEHLGSWELAQLQRTCRTLHEIARSDEVWRPRVEEIVQLHVHRLRSSNKPWKAAQLDGVYARYVDGLLGNAACYLGWWASTQAYRGRLVRVSIQLDQLGDIAAICGEEASCSNAFEGELRNLDPCLLEKRWKPLAAIWHGHGELSYRLPINHPSPDAGYSVDVLYPALSYSPIFRYTREEGFTLTASTLSGAPSTRQRDSTKISLPIRRSHRRKLNDVAGTTEQGPNRYSDDQGPSFPSRNAVRGNILRPIALFGQSEGDPGQVYLQDEYLTASCFTIQARRMGDRNSKARAASNDNSMDYIYQERDASNQPDEQPPGPVLLSNPGGNQLFRAFLEGIGAVLPPTMQDTVFGQHADDEDEQEVFYPIKGPLQHQSALNSVDQPYAALDLEGTWVGGYSTHGYEFGRIVVRNTWTRIHTADEVALEQIYDDESTEAGNADPSVTREPLMSSTVEGSLRRRRTIVEFIKITGDVNVPAGQVSWVAVLPSAEEERHPPSLAANGFSQYMQQSIVEPNLDTISLPTVKRSDWQAWSDLPPNSARLSDVGNSMPRWDEGTVRAAGRIAFTGFVDTRFIDAQATFVREENGEVDEIRVKWHEMAKVSTFRRIKLD